MKKKKTKTRNKFEDKIFRQLKRSKVSFAYEPERLVYTITGYYLPDFVIDHPSGKIYIETKGYLRPDHKRKMVAVKKANPELDIRMVFYIDKYGRFKEKDIRWAVKNGFPYAIGDIPKEWLT